MAEVSVPLLLSLFWPLPRQAQPAPALLLHLPIQVEAARGLDAPATLLRRELTRLFGAGAVAPDGKTRIRLTLAPQALTRAEEYTLETSRDGVLLRAHEAQGAFWAVHSLVQLLEAATRVPEGYRVPGVRLRDWPESPFRAFMIQGAWSPNADDLKRNLDLLARMKIRYFALEFGPQVVLDLDPGIARGGRFNKAQAKEIIDYGRSLGMQPIAYLNLLGHLERAYEKPPYTDHGGLMIGSDETYERFVFPILAEMLEVYGPVEYFHCGMDEAWELFTWLSEQGQPSADLLVRHIEKVNDFLKARGVKLVIWHDMFLAPGLREELGGPVGPANGGPPQNTAAALARIPKDVILNYWFYEPLEAYPALDYLKRQGFTVWASPWQTPFSLVRYAQARQVPTMGTLWTGPPGCFSSRTYGPVTAYYAQAAWHPGAAPAERVPEPQVLPQAVRATSAALWGRQTRAFAGAQALLLSPDGQQPPTTLAWPAEANRAPEQHAGVPFDFGRAAHFPALRGNEKALAAGAPAAYVLLPGNQRLELDGVNTNRGEDQLILYAAPKERTGTNIYGVEVAVSSTGTVLGITEYGGGDHPVPAGGFVLSAHLGTRGDKAQRLQTLRPGERVAVFDAAGNWLGGYEPGRLWAALPGDRTLRLDGVDTARAEGALLLYQPGYGEGRTGTNAFGVEVVVQQGKVTAVRKGAGNTAIPADGFVLSAHDGAADKATALSELKPGDAVRLLLEKGGRREDLAAALAGRRWSMPVNAACTTLYLVLATDGSTHPPALLGDLVLRQADGTTRRVPLRYGEHALPLGSDVWPHTLQPSAWLVERREEQQRCLVVEWQNPTPEVPLAELQIEPAPTALEIGYRVLAATAAVK